MSFNLTSPVTGGAQTAFTAPSFTHVADSAPDSNGKQYAVTVAAGVPGGVDVSSVSRPFTVTFVKPKVLKTLGQPNPITGVVTSIPRNSYKLITRKGVTPLSGQPSATMIITTTVEVPAGADSADSVNVRAALSMHVGALNQQSAGTGDSAVSGIF